MAGIVPAMGLVESVRKIREALGQGVREARHERQVAAYESSKQTDEYVTMTIMGAGELERMTRAGWELVREVPPNEHNLLKNIAPAEFLIRRAREELRRSLGL